jgi:hypothetical protein
MGARLGSFASAKGQASTNRSVSSMPVWVQQVA